MFADLIKHIKTVPLFSSVPESELEKIGTRLKSVFCKQGEIIISEGEVGDCLYIIREGRVKVVVNAGMGEDEIVLSYLTDGDYFGEMALITGEPRSATVIAETDTHLWQLDKNDFDAMVLNNPSITLSLTHMLSQRLKMANKARESSERYYKHQMAPRGSLQEVDIIKLLKFAEENSLTGKILLFHDQNKAVFDYQKGQLQSIDYKGLDEDQAMDEILDWQDGEFVIEPSVFKISEQQEEINPEKVLQENYLVSVYEKYLLEKLTEMVRFAGTRTIQSAINKSFYKFSKFFVVAKDFHIKADPSVEVHLHPTEAISERHILFMAVLMRDLMHTLEQDVLGLEFWSIHSNDQQIDEELTNQHFYEYFEQASDFIKE